MTLTVDIVRDLPSLLALRDEWAALSERSRPREVVLEPLWLLAWWRVFGGEGGRSLRVFAFRDGGKLVGLAPLLDRTHRYRLGLGFHRLELLGSGEAQEDEICSEYIGVLAEAGREREVAAALVSALSDEPFDEIVLPAMAGDGPMPALLKEAFRERGLDGSLEEIARAPYIPLPSSFDAYLGALPSSHRYVVSRSLRELERWAGGKVELLRASDRDGLAYGRHILESLHGERWEAKGRAGGVFASSRFRAFHDEVMRALFERDALDLLWLEVRGEPLAALYNIVWDGKVCFYQSGRRLDLPKPIRPGVAIHALAIQRAIEKGYREYDFLAGASQYKTQLSLATRPLVELRIVRPSLKEQARKLLVEARRQVFTARDAAIAQASKWRRQGEGPRSTSGPRGKRAAAG